MTKEGVFTRFFLQGRLVNKVDLKVTELTSYLGHRVKDLINGFFYNGTGTSSTVFATGKRPSWRHLRTQTP